MVIIASVAVVIVLLAAAFVLLLTRHSVPPISVRHIKSVKSGHEVAVTVSISNHTGTAFIFVPFRLEAREGAGWRTCCEFRADSFHPAPSLAPHSFTNYTCEVTNMPSGSSLRFTIHVQEILTGPKGFLRRLKLRRIQKAANFPLNPYDKNSKVFGMPVEVATEEFVRPEPK